MGLDMSKRPINAMGRINRAATEQDQDVLLKICDLYGDQTFTFIPNLIGGLGECVHKRFCEYFLVYR